jgi:hypothetical protein
MNDSSNAAAGLGQADEEILSCTVSDETLEAAARTEGGVVYTKHNVHSGCYRHPTWQTTADVVCESTPFVGLQG